MITASDVKNYLRIDYTDDDALITSAIQAGYDYLTDAIDDFALLYSSNTVFARKADMWVLCHYLPPMYDQREGMFTGKAAVTDILPSVAFRLTFTVPSARETFCSET